MIDLEKLKPILETLNPDASVLESILSIDEEVVNDTSEIDRLNSEVARINDEWNERFKSAFFGKSSVTEETTPDNQSIEESGDSDEERSIVNFEDLFKED